MTDLKNGKLKVVAKVSESDFRDIYVAIGASPQKISDWINEHGVDSPTPDALGRTLGPGFPTISKIAFMYVDPVRLTGSELLSLAKECDRAARKAGSAQDILDEIGTLSLEAYSKSCELVFG